MTGRYRIAAPVTTYDGKVGDDMQFVKGVYEGPVTESALAYFEGAGYSVEPLEDSASTTNDDDPDGPGGLPPKSATRPEWEQAGKDLGLTDEEVAAPANKDDLITVVTAARDSASTTNGADQ